ncbi:hypothetical protein [Amycolatopsis kentuckyensis]|uniref:hypothetical protein n=1 Tax=Amycolatopsis kentuckyensis TaxID=218823 RepID=UPI0035647580
MKLGHAGGRYPPGSTLEQRQLADLVVQLCRCMKQRTQAERAKQLWVSPAALSLFANARRVPSSDTLKLLYSLAQQGGGTTLPCSLRTLLELREIARSRLSLSRFALPEPFPAVMQAGSADPARASVAPVPQ